MGDYSKPGSVLCDILFRLNKNKKLDDTDKKWIQDKNMSNFYKFLQDWEETGKPNFYALHDSHGFPYKSFVSPTSSSIHATREVMDNYLLAKYDLSRLGDEYSRPGSKLCWILRRLDHREKLDDTDKQWIQNQKELSEFYKFIANWEEKGKPDFDSLYNPVTHVNNTKNINKCEQSPIKPKNIQDTNYSLTMKIRKQNMHSHYKKVTLAQNIESNFAELTPSKIPKDIASLILDKIWNAMHDSIQKDIKELFKVYACQQWTATSLMAMRLLENALKIHLECDLEEKSVKDMGDAIKKLEKHEYNFNLLVRLREYKEERNNLMHGNIRAGASDAKRLVFDIMTIIMSIHNIRS